MTDTSVSSKTADYFAMCVDRSNMTHIQIAKGANYSRPNVISMLRSGAMKVPIERIPDLARVLRIDPKAFLAVAMDEYHPKVWKVIKDILGDKVSVTNDEMHILEVLRAHAGPAGVKVATQEQRDALQALANSLGEADERQLN